MRIRQVLQYEAPGFVSLKVRMIRAGHRACRSTPTMKCPKVVKIRSRRRPSMAFTMMRAARSVDSTIQEGGLRRCPLAGARLDRYL